MLTRHPELEGDAYKKHHVFMELEDYIGFYGNLARSVFAWKTMGTNSICNIDSYIYSSMQGTLESIFLILKKGKINDAYELLRKYYDAAVINIYSNIYLQDHFNIDCFVVQTIENWLKGTEKLPRFSQMMKYIKESPKLNVINNLFQDDRYRKMRDTFNDHTHYNSFFHFLLNDSEICLNNRLHSLDRLLNYMREIFMLHIAYIFFLNSHYMMSSDYVDYLECGMTPETGSEYWVAPYIHDVFDKIINENRPEIAIILKKHTKMELA